MAKLFKTKRELLVQSIDLRGNAIAEVHYSGDQIVIPILIRISKNPLSLSYSLSRIRQIFLVDTENIQISDGVGQIPIREVSRYLDGHIDSVDIPLCLVMRKALKSFMSDKSFEFYYGTLF